MSGLLRPEILAVALKLQEIQDRYKPGQLLQVVLHYSPDKLEVKAIEVGRFKEIIEVNR